MPKNSIVVGCPVAARNWILPLWREHVLESCANADLTPEFFFVTACEDTDTIDLVNSFPETKVNHCTQDTYQSERRWGPERYQQMADLRNILLRNVRRRSPDWFLSLDSDILIHPRLVSNLIETYESKECAAVGGRTYLDTRDRNVISYGMFNRHGGFRRTDSTGVHKVDILMAIKLMGPQAYQTDYVADRHGEDIGWSKEIRKQGLSLYFDGRIGNKHCMNREALDKIDERVGY